MISWPTNTMRREIPRFARNDDFLTGRGTHAFKNPKAWATRLLRALQVCSRNPADSQVATSQVLNRTSRTFLIKECAFGLVAAAPMFVAAGDKYICIRRARHAFRRHHACINRRFDDDEGNIVGAGMCAGIVSGIEAKPYRQCIRTLVEAGQLLRWLAKHACPSLPLR